MQPTLYPDIKPYAEHSLAVDSNHILYVEECGTPNGLPIIFVHGGPGIGCSANDRRFFDPEKYRIILFDQRGCGRSTPHGSLENNTTAHLISDMEYIRTQLGVDRWIVFGGSWGSTLSLLYAQAHPQRVMGLILRGIFLCTEEEINWFYEPGGTSRIFPDYWQEYYDFIPEAERSHLLKAYHERLNSEDELVKMAAAKHWSLWEGRCATMQPCHAIIERFSSPHVALSLARIESHYFINRIFMEKDAILNNMHKISDIPGIIVHGRYDMICPIENAFALQKAWPQAELHIVQAGHAAMEPAICSALLNATTVMARHHG